MRMAVLPVAVFGRAAVEEGRERGRSRISGEVGMRDIRARLLGHGLDQAHRDHRVHPQRLEGITGPNRARGNAQFLPDQFGDAVENLLAARRSGWPRLCGTRRRQPIPVAREWVARQDQRRAKKYPGRRVGRVIVGALPARERIEQTTIVLLRHSRPGPPPPCIALKPTGSLIPLSMLSWKRRTGTTLPLWGGSMFWTHLLMQKPL